MFVDEEVQCGIEERTTAASGVADGDLQKPIAVSIQLSDKCFLCGHLPFLVGKVFALVDA